MGALGTISRNSGTCLLAKCRKITHCTIIDVETGAGERATKAALKTGQHNNTSGTHERAMAPSEKLTHERSGRASFDSMCETCVKLRGTSRHPRRAVSEAAVFDHATVKNSQQKSDVKKMSGSRPPGESFARAVRCKNIEDLGLFPKNAANKSWKHPSCDQAECLREVVHTPPK